MKKALAIELQLQKISICAADSRSWFSIGSSCRRAAWIFWSMTSLFVELKAVEALLPIHKAQVLSYLKATDRRSDCSSL